MQTYPAKLMIVVLVLFFSLLLLKPPDAFAQTARHSTATCKRFFLKLDPQTGLWECMQKSSSTSVGILRNAKIAQRVQVLRQKQQALTSDLRAQQQKRRTDLVQQSNDLRRQQLFLSRDLRQ